MLKSYKKVMKTGESLNYTVRANNIKNLKTTKLTIQAYNGHSIIENVKVNDTVKQYGDAEVSVTTAPNGTNSTNYTMTFTYNGTNALPEDLSLFTFDIHSISTEYIHDTIPVGSFSISTIDQSNVETKNQFMYVDRWEYTNKVSALDGAIKLEGATDPVTNQPISTIDQRLIGAKVTVTSYDGKTVVNPQISTSKGDFKAANLPVDQHAYTVKVEAPGHFTTTGSIDVTDDIRGELTGKIIRYLLPTAAAGDSNKDNVIDILDALNVQTYWGTDEASADFNFDHVVDAKDMDYVVHNFGLQNPSASNPPKAKNSFKGINLNDILNQLGIK